MTKATKTPATAIELAIAAATTFDHDAQAQAIKAYAKLKETNKGKREELRKAEGVAELALILPAMLYGGNAFDLQPLAFAIANGKLSAIAKRAIKACFPSHDFALIGDKKRPAMVHIETMAKVADKYKLEALLDVFNSGDGMTCDYVKNVFPAPDTTRSEAMAKLGKALAARMKADNLSKADIAEILKGL